MSQSLSAIGWGQPPGLRWGPSPVCEECLLPLPGLLLFPPGTATSVFRQRVRGRGASATGWLPLRRSQDEKRPPAGTRGEPQVSLRYGTGRLRCEAGEAAYPPCPRLCFRCLALGRTAQLCLPGASLLCFHLEIRSCQVFAWTSRGRRIPSPQQELVLCFCRGLRYDL